MPTTTASPPDELDRTIGTDWITAVDVARLAGCSVSAVRSWVARRKGPPHYRIMGHVRFREGEVLAWIDQRRVQGE